MLHALKCLKNWLIKPSIPILTSPSSATNLVDDEYRKLDERVQLLKTTFIDPLSTTSLRPSPQDEEFAKAFVLMFHASLEDYFEKIATILIASYLEKYRTSNFATTTDLSDITTLNQKIKSQIETYLMIVCYATFLGSKGKITEDFEKLQQQLDDKYEHQTTLTVDVLNLIKSTAIYVESVLVSSNNVLKIKFEEQNHGIALPYISKILISVGIDVNKDIRLQNSLRLVAYNRGDYAHLGQNTKITRIMSQTDLIDCMSDCLRLCEEVKITASLKYN